MMNRTQLVLGSLIVVMFAAMAGFYFLVPRHCSQGAAEDIYYIDEDFDRVRRILVRTNSLEEIVSNQHGEVLHQSWHNLNVSADRLRGPWDINGHGEFIVRTNDPDAGPLILRFRQVIHIGENSLVSESSLVEPVGNLKEYRTHMTMVRDGEKTKVTNQITLKYERRLPTSYIEYMDQKVDESASSSLEKNRESMLSLVRRYADKKLILPIKRN